MITTQKRRKMEELIYKTFSAIDPSTDNTEKFKKQFKSMTDQQFDKYFQELFQNEDNYLILDICDYERDIEMEDVEHAAKILGVELYEEIVMPYENMDKDNPVVSKYKVPVGYLHMKRMQQMLNKKNSTSTDASKNNMLTGQVTGEDKNARSSDMENYSLLVLGTENILKELLGPRGDDQVMYQEMMQQIANNEPVILNELTNNVKNKVALNTLNIYMLGMGIHTDLITKNLILPSTLE